MSHSSINVTFIQECHIHPKMAHSSKNGTFLQNCTFIQKRHIHPKMAHSSKNGTFLLTNENSSITTPKWKSWFFTDNGTKKSLQSSVPRIDSNKIISLTLQDVLWTYINIRCLWIPPPNVCNQATIVAQLWRYHHIFRFPAKKILEKMHKFHNKVNKSSKGCFKKK